MITDEALIYVLRQAEELAAEDLTVPFRILRNGQDETDLLRRNRNTVNMQDIRFR